MYDMTISLVENEVWQYAFFYMEVIILSIECLLFILTFHSYYKIDETKINEKKKRSNLKDTGTGSCHFFSTLLNY